MREEEREREGEIIFLMHLWLRNKYIKSEEVKNKDKDKNKKTFQKEGFSCLVIKK